MLMGRTGWRFGSDVVTAEIYPSVYGVVMTAALPRRPGPTRRVRVTEHAGQGVRRREDRVAVEEPLEIRLKSPLSPPRRVAVVMRTPGHDFELAAGWLASEGLLSAETLHSVAYCTDNSVRRDQEFNVVTIDVTHELAELPQSRVVDSACGVCGTDSVAAVSGPPPVELEDLDATALRNLPGVLRAGQAVFDRTGGTHGAALCAADGSVVVTREDVGRHNALDKALGHVLLNGLPTPPIAVLSGRLGFELVQKAVAGGVTVIVAVGAPTSLAVDIAAANGRTLIGFTSPDRCVVFTGGDRLREPDSH